MPTWVYFRVGSPAEAEAFWRARAKFPNQTNLTLCARVIRCPTWDGLVGLLDNHPGILDPDQNLRIFGDLQGDRHVSGDPEAVASPKLGNTK